MATENCSNMQRAAMERQAIKCSGLGVRSADVALRLVGASRVGCPGWCCFQPGVFIQGG